MSSLDCIYNAKINCCKDGKCTDDMCPDSHHCCTQNAKSPNLGLCVKKDDKGGKSNCNKNTGLPISNCRDKRNESETQAVEEFAFLIVNSKEGYNTDYLDIKNGMKFLAIIAVILLAYIFLMRRR